MAKGSNAKKILFVCCIIRIFLFFVVLVHKINKIGVSPIGVVFEGGMSIQFVNFPFIGLVC